MWHATDNLLKDIEMEVKYGNWLPMDTEENLPSLKESLCMDQFSPDVRSTPEVAVYMEIESETESGSDIGYALQDLEELWDDDDDDDEDELMVETEGEVCFGCGLAIRERFLLKVSGRAWHGACLRCCVCEAVLDRHTTCFIREDLIYCKLDYAREFGVKCAKCCRHIQSTDWVRRARDNVYHLACFACDACKRQLSTGEEFALQDDRVLCKTHYVEVIEGGSGSDEGSSQKQKTKRVRTTFTEEQLQVLQANFQLDSNPDGQDLERIAQITGLSKRVTQVWFQNSRARQKKHQQTTHNRVNNLNSLSAPSNVSICDSIMTSSSLSSGSPSPGSTWQNGLGQQSEPMIYAS